VACMYNSTTTSVSGTMADVNPNGRQNPPRDDVKNRGQPVGANTGPNASSGNGQNMETPAIAGVAGDYDDYLFANYYKSVVDTLHLLRVDRVRDELTNPPMQLSRDVLMNYEARLGDECAEVSKAKKKIVRAFHLLGKHLYAEEHLQTMVERYKPALVAFEKKESKNKDFSRERRQNTANRQQAEFEHHQAMRNNNQQFMAGTVPQQRFQQQSYSNVSMGDDEECEF